MMMMMVSSLRPCNLREGISISTAGGVIVILNSISKPYYYMLSSRARYPIRTNHQSGGDMYTHTLEG